MMAFWVLSSLLQGQISSALDNGVALTPPMGFNSYMAGETLQNEHGLRRVADFFGASGMQDLGFVYINTDEGWEEKDRGDDGKLRWNSTLYPSGLPHFIDELHLQGFFFGIYGASSGVTCGELPGQLYHEVDDAQTYASWGVDFLKSDNCATFALDSSVRFRAMSDALNGTNMVLSIEPFSMTPDPAQSSEIANMWRTGTDIRGSFHSFTDRADTADKWAPIAGPRLGWNDPDMINVHNKLTLGENRLYFGLWAIMKAPLLLSTNLYELNTDVRKIITAAEVIKVNQDPLGVPARKIQIDGNPLPWIVGLEDCSGGPKFYSRKVAPGPAAGPGSVDTRQWKLEAVLPEQAAVWHVRNSATDRCLTVSSGTSVTLLPCNSTSIDQHWRFNKGVKTVTSITNQGRALAISESYLYGRVHGKDNYTVSDIAYGDTGLILEEPQDQDACDSRWCENYRPQQMWYYSAGLLRHALYTSSMNHIEDYQDGNENGYILSHKVPTFRHHCLSHVLSAGNVGTTSGTTEVWAGPLEGGDLVIGLVNRGDSPAVVEADLQLAFTASGYDQSHFQGALHVRDLWKDEESTMLPNVNKVQEEVGPHDIKILRLTLNSMLLV